MNQVFALLRKIGLISPTVAITTQSVPVSPKQTTSSSGSAVSSSTGPSDASTTEPIKPVRSTPKQEPRPINGSQTNFAAQQTMWLGELVRNIISKRDARMASFLDKPTAKLSAEQRHAQTYKMMARLSSALSSLAFEINQMILELPVADSMRLTLSELREVVEEEEAKPYGMVTKGATSKQQKKSKKSLRFRISSQSWCLSMRGYRGRIDLFLVPSRDLLLMSKAETPSRLRAVLKLNDRLGDDTWTLDELPAGADELFYLCRQLLKTLLLASAIDMEAEIDAASALLQNLEGDALKATVHELLLAGQNMAQKIVSQQEEIQNQIARDLHDTVIADLMVLKRSLAGDAIPTSSEMNSSLDKICERIRDVCHDLAPRDLRDWGLQTVIDDMLERVAQRAGADCSFECDRELPELPAPVQLHLFRIVQESLNNIEKYAKASRITVRFEVSTQILRLTVTDDGLGYNAADLDRRRSSEGGSGLSGIRERAEMIRCFYPTKLTLQSTPGAGSTTMLELTLNDGGWHLVTD